MLTIVCTKCPDNARQATSRCSQSDVVVIVHEEEMTKLIHIKVQM